MKRPKPDTHLQKARTLRRAMTPPERRLWTALRDRPDGHKFRRQHPCEPWVLDFYCDSAALAIEVDGMAHELGDNPLRDRRRDAWLAERGIKTLRFRATDIRDNLDRVVDLIREECAARTPSTGFDDQVRSAPHCAAMSGGHGDLIIPPPLEIEGRRE